MQRGLGSAVSSRFVALALLTAFVAASFAVHASAQTADTRLAENRKEQLETTKEIDSTNSQLDDLLHQRAEMELGLQQIATEVAIASDRLAKAQADSARYDAEAVTLETQITKTQKKLDEAKAATRRSAVLLYQRSDSTAMIGMIGSVDAAGDFVEGSHYLNRISDKRHGDAAREGTLRLQLDGQKSKLDETRTAADAARDLAASEKDRLDNLFVQQERAIANSRNAEQTIVSKRDELAAKQADLTAQFQKISDEIAASLANQANTPALGTGLFLWPVGKVPIVSGFGYRTDPFTGEPAFHAGLDFAAPCGTYIKAADSGVIFSAGDNGGYGLATIINHGAGLATLYGHQQAIAVSAGQVVERGQVIGYVGSTGHSTGCHLHFEVRVNGTPVNPLAGYL